MEQWRWRCILSILLLTQLFSASQCKSQLVYPDFFKELPTPDQCEGDQTFCGGDESKYPKDEINEIVARTLELKRSPETVDRFFQEFVNKTLIEAEGSASTTPVNPDSLVPAEDGSGRGLLELKPTCWSRTEIIPRFSRAKNVLGKWMYLIDGSSGRQQNVEVTICENPDHVCDNDLDSPYGVGTTVCKQLYRTHKLLAVDDGGEVVVDTFELPSACVCNYKSNFDLGFRNSDDFLQPYRDIQCSMSEVTESIKSKFTTLMESEDVTGAEEDTPTTTAAATTTVAVNTEVPEDQDEPIVFEPEPCGTGTGEGFFRICEDPTDTTQYPEIQIRKLLRRHPTFKSPEHFQKLFGKPCEFAESLTKFRIGFELTESPLCTSFESYIFPKVAKNIRGVWRYIINTREYRQGVTIETCHRKAIGASCKYGGREGLKPEATVCKQLYAHHNLLTLTERGLLEYETFLIPSACSCHLTESPYTPLFPMD